MEMAKPDKGTLALQSAVAMVLALVVYVVIASLASMAIYFVQSFMTVIRPGLIQFMAIIAGSFVGMMAAKSACDAVLKGYSSRAVFIMFVVLIAAMVIVEVGFVPMNMNQINSGAQLIASWIAAYSFFWREA
jgi:hypothetical protein